MEIPQHLLERLKKNEEITRKFNEIEISILSILNFKDFFERLLFLIADKFSIPHIWLSFIQESSICEQLKDLGVPKALNQRLLLWPRNVLFPLSRTKNQYWPIGI